MVKDATRRSNPGCVTLLIVGGLIASSSRFAFCQANSAPPSAATPVTSAQQKPAYDVATIKPAEPNGYAMSLRVYIQSAYGIPVNSNGWVIGPDWIDSARYVIRGKPTESMQKDMQTMSVEERSQQTHLLMQGLLEDRFKLKAHYENREMPVYQLVIAKGGPKLKENTDSAHGQLAVNPSLIRGKAAPMPRFLEMLESVPDIGGRVIVDKTGLSGTYDFLLKWTPLGAAASSGASPSPDAESVSLFTAIEEQLGLKLVPVKEPGQVLVIDQIERPSEN